jgi:hypothetical protein
MSKYCTANYNKSKLTKEENIENLDQHDLLITLIYYLMILFPFFSKLATSTSTCIVDFVISSVHRELGVSLRSHHS